MNIIYYQTKTQFENTGDVLINKSLIELLRNYGKLKCNCSTNIPKSFIEELDIKKDEMIVCKNELMLSFKIIKDALKAKREKNHIFFFSGLGHHWGGGIKKCLRIFASSFVFLLYRLFGVVVVKIGSSVGPLSNGMKHAESFRGKIVNYYYVRDTKSFELCKKIKIKKVKMCPDLSWAYLNNKEKRINISNNILVSFRKSTLDEDNDDYKKLLFKSLEKILETINKQNHKIYFCYQVKRDRDFVQRCYNEFKDKYNCIFVEEQITLDNAKKYYSQATYTISNRLHSLLLGYKYGALPIAVIDRKQHIKITQIFEDNDLSDLIFDIKGSNINIINRIISDKELYFKKVLNVEKESSIEIKSVLDTIFKEKGD